MAQITSKKPIQTKVYFGPGVDHVSPTYGPGDTSVMITGNGLTGATQVMFGGNSAGFTILSDNSIKATAPLKGMPGTTVPVTAVNGGKVLPTSATFSFPIAEMDVTGPMPFARGTVGDPTWYSGGGHSISVNPPKTLTFALPSPTIHVRIAFSDDANSYPPGSYTGDLVGNKASYSVWAEMCSLNGVPSFAIADTHAPCTNFDNNSGTWVDLPTQSVTLSSAGPGQTTFGDITVKLGDAFDQENTVRTFRLHLSLQQQDTHTAEAEGYRMASTYSSPFVVLVSPAALIQLSVVPHTILYQPTGDESTVTFTATTNYGTNYSLGNSTDASNSSSDTQKSSDNFNFSMAFFLGVTNTQKGSWDTTTKESFGTTNTSTNGGSSGMTFTGTWNAPAAYGLLPGSGATCASATDCSQTKQDPNIRAKEPFWLDRFILFVHPQFAVWVLGDNNDRFVMYGAVPVTANADVAQLDACVGGQKPYNLDQCSFDYTDDGMTGSNGGGLFYSGSTHSIELTKADASNLLKLDPFYLGGQGVQLPVTRAIPVASANYGAKIGKPATPYTVTLNNVTQTNQGTNTQQSHTSSLTDVIGTDNSIGLTFSAANSGANYKAGLTLDNSDQISSDTTLKTTFTDSTASTNQNVTQASVTLNDVDNTTAGSGGPMCKTCHDPLPQYPSVNIYMDRIFGSFMFQDPGAPHTTLSPLGAMPQPVQCTSVFLATATSEEQSWQRFSDVPKDAPAHTAIGLLARMHLLTGSASGQFNPNAPLTRVELATILNKTLDLPSGPRRTFSDLAPTSTAAGAASAVVSAGLLKTPSSQFGPSEPVSRQDLATSLARGFKITGTAAAPVADSAQIAPDATAGVNAMVGRGFMKLTPSNTFQPSGVVTRGEAAQIIVSVLNDREERTNAANPSCPSVSTPLSATNASQPTPPAAPQPAPANSTILVPENAYPGGLLTGVVIGPDDQPVPNTPVDIAGGVPANLGGNVVGDPVPCSAASATDPACQPQPAQPTPATTPAPGLPTAGTPGTTVPHINCASLLRAASTTVGSAVAGGTATATGNPGATPAATAAGVPIPQQPSTPAAGTPGGATQVVTDAAGRFVLCMAPSSPTLSVNLPGGTSVSVPAATGQPPASTVPPDFFQPGQNITLSGPITDPTATQNGRTWNLPVARAWSPDGSQAVTVMRAPKNLGVGPVQISYTGPDGERHSRQGTSFRIIRAFLDRAQLHSNQGATFEYDVQFLAQTGQQLCVQMHVAGPVVLIQPPAPIIPIDNNGLGRFKGRIRATQVAPGSTVPFDLTPSIHFCNSN